MTDGWGLATDGKIFFGSDGTSTLYQMDPQTMKGTLSDFYYPIKISGFLGVAHLWRNLGRGWILNFSAYKSYQTTKTISVRLPKVGVCSNSEVVKGWHHGSKVKTQLCEPLQHPKLSRKERKNKNREK